MSALPHKRTFVSAIMMSDLCQTETNCTATKRAPIRSPRRRGRVTGPVLRCQAIYQRARDWNQPRDWRKRFKKYLSIWLFLIAKNWSLSLPATYRCWLPQKNEFIADHYIWRRRTCFKLWIFYSSRTLNISTHSSDWNDGWISSGSTRW